MNNIKKKQLSILHLASFTGNIGDYANHQGFYSKLNKKINANFTQLEIRKFYINRNEMSFDQSFVKLVNTHDALIIGGGGFFDLKWDYSRTGTTIDFSKKIIEDIKVPVIVNAIGYHEYEKVNKTNIDKFNRFLETVAINRKWFLSVRNDGSFDRLKDRYGKNIKKIYRVPDNGFIYHPNCKQRQLRKEKTTIWIGMNLTNELFSKRYNDQVTTNLFNKKISKFINLIFSEEINFKIIFFTHTTEDISTLGKILVGIDDKFKRERVFLAPFYTSNKTVDQIFDLYKICRCVIAMRFHSNVCCLSMNIPTIGLAGHQQISDLYNEINLKNQCVKVNNKNFIIDLENKFRISVKDAKKITKENSKINVTIKHQSDYYFNQIKNFLKENI